MEIGKYLHTGNSRMEEPETPGNPPPWNGVYKGYWNHGVPEWS